MAASLINLVGDYLFENRIGVERAQVERLAVEFAPLLASADADALYAAAREAGAEMNGRLLVLDLDAKVQMDTFSLLNGRRLGHPEIVAVVNGAASDYGFHRLASEAAVPSDSPLAFLRQGETGAWVGYFTASIQHEGEAKGLLLYSVNVQGMVSSLLDIRDRMLIYFCAAAVLVVLVSVVFSRVITKPVAVLDEGIRRMARGDLSGRVRVGGHDEMSRLADAFNQMSEKLEHLDASRNEFVSNASHELKTPLATMKILLQSMLYEPSMDPAVRGEFMADIDKELDRLSLIVTDLLTLVQADAHDFKLDRRPLILREVVEETLHRLRPLAEDKGCRLEYNASTDGAMEGDAVRLAQAVYNLVENAIKYTPKGGRVRVTLRAEGQRRVVFEVSDTGPGIPKADQAHVFDRFYRVDKARSRATGGNGLGLSIVHQAVMLHEGSVTLRSEEGKGAAFRVELPTS